MLVLVFISEGLASVVRQTQWLYWQNGWELRSLLEDYVVLDAGQ